MFEGVLLTTLSQQWLIYAVSVLLGSTISIFALLRAKSERFWKLVDLFWISIGTIATAAAVVTTFYLSEITEAQRRIDRLRANIADLNAATEMFLAIHCSQRTLGSIIEMTSGAMREACGDASIIAFETRPTSDLVSFTELLAPSVGHDETSALMLQIQSNFDLSSSTYTNENGIERTIQSLIEAKWMSRTKLTDEQFDELGRTILFTGFYDQFFLELSAIRSRSNSIEGEVESVRSTWQLIIGKRSLLILRILALALISFVAPLRIGKSIFDINKA